MFFISFIRFTATKLTKSLQIKVCCNLEMKSFTVNTR